MIVDSIPLAGQRSQLLSPTNRSVNLAGEKSGTTEPIGDGVAFDIEGIAIYLEGPELISRFQSASQPLFEIELTKEVVPGLFLDPYSHRLHTISGGADLLNGVLTNCDVITIEGRDTLVSLDDGEPAWHSAIYSLRKSSEFTHAAWELDASLKSSGYSYGLTVDFWVEGADTSSDPSTNKVLAPVDTPLSEPRAVAANDWPDNIIAYRVNFEAKVVQQGAIVSRVRGDQAQGFGQTLLRSFALAEKTEAVHAYHSLEQVRNASVDAQMVPDSNQPVGFGATVDFSAKLEEGESIVLRLLQDGIFDWFEARLIGSEHQRPHAITGSQ